jgi:hypothetical protein
LSDQEIFEPIAVHVFACTIPSIGQFVGSDLGDHVVTHITGPLAYLVYSLANGIKTLTEPAFLACR